MTKIYNIKNYNTVILSKQNVMSIKRYFIRTCLTNISGYSLGSVYSDIDKCPACTKKVYQAKYFFGITTIPKKIIESVPPSTKKPFINFEELRKITICHFDCLDVEDYVPEQNIRYLFITFKYHYNYYAFQFKPAITVLEKYIYDRHNCYIEDVIDEDEYKVGNLITQEDEHYTGEITQGTQEEDIPSMDLSQGDLFDPADMLGLVPEGGHTSFSMRDLIEQEKKYLHEGTIIIPPVKKQFKIYSLLKII